MCLCAVNFFIFVYLRTIACLWRHIRMQLFLFVHLYSWTRVGALWVTRIANIIYWTCVFVNRSRLKFIQNLAFVFFDSYPCIVDFIKCLLERSWLYPMKNTRKYSNTNRVTCVVWKHFRFYKKFRMFFSSYRKCLQRVDKRSNGKPISFVAKWFKDNIHFLTV